MITFEREDEFRTRRGRQWDPMPKPSGTPLPVRSKGIGEIKPHYGPSRREGMKQLCEKAKRGDEKWLVTYVGLDSLHRPLPFGRPSFLRVAAQKITCTKDPNAATKKIGRPVGKLIVLDDVELDQKIAYPSVNEPGFFGHAAEKVAQAAFKRALPKDRKPHPGTGGPRPGPDLMWDELAALYSELAELVPDPLFAEIAEELQNLTGWPPPYDRAHAVAGSPGR